MRIFSLVWILLFSLVLSACGGSSGTDEGVIVNPETGSGLITGTAYSFSSDFTVTSGADVVYQPGSYDYQDGSTIANSDNSIICYTGSELIEPELSNLSTVNESIISNYGNAVVSFNNISVGNISGQEAILSYANNSGLVITEIARHYYVPAERFILDTNDSVVFYFGCATAADVYAQNEATMRTILNSIRFNTSDANTKRFIASGRTEISNTYE